MQVLTGYRLPKPETCPEQLYTDIIQPSWQADPLERPSMQTIAAVFLDTVYPGLNIPLPTERAATNLSLLSQSSNNGTGDTYVPASSNASRLYASPGPGVVVDAQNYVLESPRPSVGKPAIFSHVDSQGYQQPVGVQSAAAVTATATANEATVISVDLDAHPYVQPVPLGQYEEARRDSASTLSSLPQPSPTSTSQDDSGYQVPVSGRGATAITLAEDGYAKPIAALSHTVPGLLDSQGYQLPLSAALVDKNTFAPQHLMATDASMVDLGLNVQGESSV
jgi:hypothetical protein